MAEGIAAGLLYVADAGPPADATAEQVREAFAAVAADRHDLAERLRVAGRAAEADIIGVAALIAADPAAGGARRDRGRGRDRRGHRGHRCDRSPGHRAGRARGAGDGGAGRRRPPGRPGRHRPSRGGGGAAAAGRGLHPGAARGQPGRPDRAGRGRPGRRGLGGRGRQLARGDHRPRPRPAHDHRGGCRGTGGGGRAARGARRRRRRADDRACCRGRARRSAVPGTGSGRPGIRACRHGGPGDHPACNVASAAETGPAWPPAPGSAAPYRDPVHRAPRPRRHAGRSPGARRMSACCAPRSRSRLLDFSWPTAWPSTGRSWRRILAPAGAGGTAIGPAARLLRGQDPAVPGAALVLAPAAGLAALLAHPDRAPRPVARDPGRPAAIPSLPCSSRWSAPWTRCTRSARRWPGPPPRSVSPRRGWASWWNWPHRRGGGTLRPGRGLLLDRHQRPGRSGARPGPAGPGRAARARRGPAGARADRARHAGRPRSRSSASRCAAMPPPTRGCCRCWSDWACARSACPPRGCRGSGPG